MFGAKRRERRDNLERIDWANGILAYAAGLRRDGLPADDVAVVEVGEAKARSQLVQAQAALRDLE